MANKTKKPSQDDIVKFLSEKGKRIGFSLENYVLKILKKNYLNTQHRIYYTVSNRLPADIFLICMTES